MCIQIDSRCVILNIMQVHERVELSQLKTFAIAFKQRVHEAYVDISDASVFGAIEDNQEILSLTGNTIDRTEAFGSFAEREFLDKTVNRHFDDTIRSLLHECAEAAF